MLDIILIMEFIFATFLKNISQQIQLTFFGDFITIRVHGGHDVYSGMVDHQGNEPVVLVVFTE